MTPVRPYAAIYRNLTITTTTPAHTPSTPPTPPAPVEEQEAATTADALEQQIEDLLTPTYHPACSDFNPLAHRPQLTPKCADD